MTEQDLISLIEEALEERKKKRKKSKKKKEDRCTRIAKRKYDVWPSAYASGAVVRCRKGKIWKGLKEEELAELSEEELLEILAEEEDEPLDEKKRKLTKKPSSETSLRDWFGRKGAQAKKAAGLTVMPRSGKTVRSQVIRVAVAKKVRKDLNTLLAAPQRLHVRTKGTGERRQRRRMNQWKT